MYSEKLISAVAEMNSSFLPVRVKRAMNDVLGEVDRLCGLAKLHDEIIKNQSAVIISLETRMDEWELEHGA